MVTTLPLIAGVGLVVVAVGGLLEVTNYTEQQRRDERRQMQAFTYGCLIVLTFGLVVAWTGFRGESLPTWLFAGSSVAVAATIVVQWRLRRTLADDT